MNSFAQVGVLGAGQMGAGIAQACAAAGHRVTLSDADLSRAEGARAGIAARLERLVEKGKLGDAEARAILGRIVPRPPLEHDGDELVVEAVSEHYSLKADLLERLSERLSPEVMLASNTSSISITKLASNVRDPSRFVGLHFMNPVPIMKLVELVRGLETSEESLAQARSFAEGLGKTCIVAVDRPGFVVNRVLIPMLNEACFALGEGVASMEDIDSGAKLGLNHPLGPLELADLIGLDTVLAIAEVLHEEFADSKYRPAPLLKNLVRAGHFGRKSGRGFYDYTSGYAAPRRFDWLP